MERRQWIVTAVGMALASSISFAAGTFAQVAIPEQHYLHDEGVVSAALGYQHDLEDYVHSFKTDLGGHLERIQRATEQVKTELIAGREWIRAHKK